MPLNTYPPPRTHAIPTSLVRAIQAMEDPAAIESLLVREYPWPTPETIEAIVRGLGQLLSGESGIFLNEHQQRGVSRFLLRHHPDIFCMGMHQDADAAYFHAALRDHCQRQPTARWVNQQLFYFMDGAELRMALASLSDADLMPHASGCLVMDSSTPNPLFDGVIKHPAFGDAIRDPAFYARVLALPRDGWWPFLGALLAEHQASGDWHTDVVRMLLQNPHAPLPKLSTMVQYVLDCIETTPMSSHLESVVAALNEQVPGFRQQQSSQAARRWTWLEHPHRLTALDADTVKRMAGRWTLSGLGQIKMGQSERVDRVLDILMALPMTHLQAIAQDETQQQALQSLIAEWTHNASPNPAYHAARLHHQHAARLHHQRVQKKFEAADPQIPIERAVWLSQLIPEPVMTAWLPRTVAQLRSTQHRAGLSRRP